MGSRNAGSLLVGINIFFAPDIRHHMLHFDVIMVTNSEKKRRKIKVNVQPQYTDTYIILYSNNTREL
jgi:hypothetical protein